MEKTINTQLEQFREQVYQSSKHSADALMDLLDALSSQTRARSVAELSLEACFRREYSSLYSTIDQFFQAVETASAEEARRDQKEELLQIVAATISPSEQQRYWLFGTDATSIPRQFSRTLADRTYVYRPNTVAGNKPVTIGHQYVVMAYLPEKTEEPAPPWVVPLAMGRVTSQEKETDIGANLLEMLMNNECLPWHGGLSVHTSDSRYSTPQYLHKASAYKDLVTITRLRSNRVLYRQPAPMEGKRGKGHPRWFGERFALREPETWHEPDEVAEVSHTSRRGRSYIIRIMVWHNMLMRGKRGCPMHKHPFTLVCICWLDADGRPVFKRPIWLIISGQRRHELSPTDAQSAYAQRYDMEHFFRFGKQRLLLSSYQTPDLEHEENWVQLVLLAYVQLWLVRFFAQRMPRPWERYLPDTSTGPASPSAVQREFGRIIQQFGTPAAAPIPRGNSPGRPAGTRLKPRKRHPVVKKGKKKS